MKVGEKMKKNQKNLFAGLFLLATFVLWTVAVAFIDVQPIGPQGSSVGFAAVNGFVQELIGINMALYAITDWLSIIPLAFVGGFAALGFFQWIKRKSFLKVDFSIIALGVFYIAVMAAFLLFEFLIINYRPALIEGNLEVSYPSSTTMLVICVMPTSIMQLNERIKNRTFKRFVRSIVIAFTAFMVVGRILSGVHWITDIIGGALLSAGFVSIYKYVCLLKRN